MRRNIILTAVTLALAGLCSLVGLITVHAAAPSLLPSHAVALTVGVATLAVMMAMGQNRLSMAGLIVSLCVAVLCLCCFIEESDYGYNREIVMFGWQLLEPSFFVTPALILLLAWTRRNHQGTIFFAVSSILALLLVALMPRLSEATVVLVLAAVLYGLVVRINRHKAIRCLIAAAFALSPFVIREIRMQLSGRSWFGPDSLIGSYIDFSIFMVSNAEWFGGAASRLPFPPPGHLAANTLGYASYCCGNWTLVFIAVAWTLLAVCLVIAARRARSATQRILAVGGAISLITQMALGILHFAFLIPRHSTLLPFVSANGSYTVACFAMLGIVLSTLRNDLTVTEAIKRKHRFDTCVWGALLVAVTTAGAVLFIHKMSLPQTQIARMLPESEPGFSFDAKNGVLSNDVAYVPAKRVTGIGEPSIVIALAAFHDGKQISLEDISREPPIVAAKCRIRPDGRIALDCRDLYEEEFTLVFKPSAGESSATETTTAADKWKISLAPQGHLGCTNLWTDVRVTEALSNKLKLDYSFVSNAMARTDSRYIKLKITSDPDEIACAKRNRRFWRLVIEKEPKADIQ